MAETLSGDRTLYCHRELPPVSAEAIGVHTIEATSSRVPGTIARRRELWDSCYEELMEQARVRIRQKIARLRGDYAHVVTEKIVPRHDDRTDEVWMYGRFDYELYRASR